VIILNLRTYLIKNYQPNQPIIAADITIKGLANSYKNIQLSNLVKQKVIKRFSPGVYYFSTINELGESSLNSLDVASAKFINKQGDIIGYVSGGQYAKMLGISEQIVNQLDIYTNVEKSIKRSVKVGSLKINLRKPHYKIDQENYKILQFLDFITNTDIFIINKNKTIFSKKIQQIDIKKELLNQILAHYPAKTFKKLTLTGLIYEFNK
jgi:hypothetical protein